MQGNNVSHRRVQFSSCDQCRKSRVACDAGRARRSTNGSQALLTCTRCTNRDSECTFEWMKKGNRSSSVASPRSNSRKNKTVGKRQSHRRQPPDHGLLTDVISIDSPNPHFIETSGSDGQTPSTPRSSLLEASDESLKLDIEGRTIDIDRQWLRSIYEQGFETIFGSWMGRYSNPFLFGEQSDLELSVSISRLCRQLDRWIAEESYNESIFGNPSHPGLRRGSEFDMSLHHAIEAYAARWLPLTLSNEMESSPVTEIVKGLWRRARRDMLKVINMPSYQSMLSLLLFALTPIPAGISDSEELDGVSGQVCVHAALQQIQQLRARQRSLQFNGTRVEIGSLHRNSSVSPQSLTTMNFINAESTAYWAALTFDTSASLTLSCRPLLSSGLFGCESESSWRMVRSCSEVFREMKAEWSAAGLELSDERANQVIAAGSAWKLLLWKLTANFKESLRDGHNEFEVTRSFTAVSEAIDKYDAIYKDLLEACYNRIHFLSQDTKFRWYELTLHYHLCILMLVDIAEATDRHDLLLEFSSKRINAENWVLNCLKFGVANKYTIRRSSDVSNDNTMNGTDIGANVTVSFIAIDPYAHHVVAAVKLMQLAIDRDLSVGKISPEVHQDLLSTLSEAVCQLPQGSKSVQIARANISSQPLYR